MEKRPIIIFDLDETLICTVNMNRLPSSKRDIKRLIDILAKRDIEYIIDDSHGDIIFKRPNLDQFLDWIYCNFHTGIFTKGMPDYAEFINTNIINTKNRRILSNNDTIFIGTSNDCEYINENFI